MPRSLRLNIPEPCHENWHNMTPAEQGRFCGSCQKTVVDFTLMTDKELLDYFSKASEHTCGRFSNDQLNKDLRPVAVKKRFSWAYVWNIVLATFLITKADAQVVKKKTPEVQLPERAPETQGEMEFVNTGKASSSKELKGVVLNSANNTPLVGASIIVKGTSRGVATDSLGHFKLSIDNDKPFQLVVSYVGYVVQTVQIDSTTNRDDLKVTLVEVPSEEMLGVVVTAYRKPRKNKIINDWKPAILKKDIKIYPNPVVKGNDIQASLSLKQAGEYKMELINMQGEVMAVQKLEMMTKEQAVTIPTQSNWSSGIYLVRITAPGVKNVYQCKVSIQ